MTNAERGMRKDSPFSWSRTQLTTRRWWGQSWASLPSGTICLPDRPRTAACILAFRSRRGFRQPYRQSEMSQAEAHYQ